MQIRVDTGLSKPSLHGGHNLFDNNLVRRVSAKDLVAVVQLADIKEPDPRVSTVTFIE